MRVVSSSCVTGKATRMKYLLQITNLHIVRCEFTHDQMLKTVSVLKYSTQWRKFYSQFPELQIVSHGCSIVLGTPDGWVLYFYQ